MARVLDEQRRIDEQRKADEQPRIAEELGRMAYEPLLPVEKKLIGWSLSLGIGLLVVLWLVAHFAIKAGG